MAKCEICGKEVSDKVERFSREHFANRVLCFDCQQAEKGEVEGAKHDGTEADEWKFEQKEEAKQEEEAEKKVKTEDGEFSFREEAGTLFCISGENEYELDITKPECSCSDFKIRRRMCKHLKAAAAAGYSVTPLPEVPTTALAKQEAKKPEPQTISVRLLERDVELPVQTLDKIITNEEQAVAAIRAITGDKPSKANLIESYDGIEEISADVVLSLASLLGIQYRIVEKEVEKAKMNLGKIYEAIATPAQTEKYGNVASLMPEVDIVVRCKVTTAAAWADRKGNTRVAFGVKEELLTPAALADIAKRGANFVETKAITKAAKKALLSVLPVTHDGLLAKLKRVFRW